MGEMDHLTTASKCEIGQVKMDGGNEGGERESDMVETYDVVGWVD